jgi:hypothetical protein
MLYVFQTVPPPITRSSNSTYSFWYFSNLAASCCHLGWDGTGLELEVLFELLMMGEEPPETFRVSY